MARTSEALDPVGYTAAVSAAATVLGAHAVGLDGLGVTPDPGGGGEPPDPAAHGTGPGAAQPGSGSDLAATLEAAAASAEGRGSFAEVGSSMARAATSAASGPAGAGLAAFLAGMSEALANADRLDGPRFALCLEAGAERLAPRDDGRHPGGFVAVASAAADAALDAADRGSSLGETVLAAANAGIEELEKGPVLDPRLAE
ncbi:MAG: DAK2 domain-containing protein, partial [Microthrixaceae bacterium]|nr:DAK2 domain-containing protein [Microthrixaceae bacterium]